MEIVCKGQFVRKVGRNGKPFKGGKKIEQVTALCSSLYDKRRKLAYVLSDGSIVNVDRCMPVGLILREDREDLLQ